MRKLKKSTILLLLLATTLLLASNFSAIKNTAASAEAGSDSVNLLQANVLWEKTYGGTGDDRAFCATPVAGGFIVAGSSKSLEEGKVVAWALTLDNNGNMLWNRTFSESAESEFRSVLGLEDGLLLVGNVFLPSQDINGYVVRTDSEGKLLWNITLGGENIDKLFSAVKTLDGFVLVGLTYSFGNSSEVWVVKINREGNVVWNNSYGWSMADAGRAIALTADGHYVVAGYTNSTGSGDYDFLLLKIDASGNLSWSKTFGGAQSDKAYALAETTAGFVVIGDTRSKGEGDSDAWIIKVDGNGDLVWDRPVGGEGFDMPTCVTVSNNGGYVVGGFTFSFGNGERDFWLFKVNDEGNLSWSCTVGRSAFEEAYATLETGENEFVMAGWTNSIGEGHYDFYVTKIAVENSGAPSAYEFITSALILAAVTLAVLIVLFYIIKRRVNQKISRLNENSDLKHDA